jgi:hypothetical protein
MRLRRLRSVWRRAPKAGLPNPKSDKSPTWAASTASRHGGRLLSGAFAEWQPRYAEQGVATFPVRDKKPCVRRWQSVGLNGSLQLALKFPEADAFGFQCGNASRITLVDIDSSEKRVVEEAIKIFGASPVVWRTGSGNFAMPFRFNGEKRRIRPFQSTFLAAVAIPLPHQASVARVDTSSLKALLMTFSAYRSSLCQRMRADQHKEKKFRSEHVPTFSSITR